MAFTHYVPPPLGIVKPSRSEIKYSLIVVQNPEKARCCGFGEKDRRLIDPPPIVELKATLHGQHLSLNQADTKLFSVQCDLFSSNTKHRCSLVYPPPYYSAQEEVMIKSPPLRNLLGSVVSNAYVLYNLENERGVYFVFSDLSVRTEGEFTLQFRFNDLDAGEPMTASTSIQAEVFSRPFQVFTPKNFEGMSDATELSKCFFNQGVKIITRKPSNTKRSIEMEYT